MTMNMTPVELVAACKRALRVFRGERVLVTTFWPQDLRRGTEHHFNGQTYRVTGYVRTTDERFFEVWGRAVPSGMRLAAPVVSAEHA